MSECRRKKAEIGAAREADRQECAMILVSAYKNGSTRSQAASALPDVIEAYIPQWEQIIDGARARREGSDQS